MSDFRPHSRKIRALQQAFEMTAEAVVDEYRGKPLSYREIASEWTHRVRGAFPELGIEFNTNDVYRLFKHCGVQTQGLDLAPTAGAAA